MVTAALDFIANASDTTFYGAVLVVMVIGACVGTWVTT